MANENKPKNKDRVYGSYSLHNRIGRSVYETKTAWAIQTVYIQRCPQTPTHNRNQRQASHYVQCTVSLSRTAWNPSPLPSPPLRLVGILRKIQNQRSLLCAGAVCGGLSDKPFLLAFLNGLCERRLSTDDGGVCGLGRLRSLCLVGVVGPLVAEHVANQEDQSAEDGEYHHSNNPCSKNTGSRITLLQKTSFRG